MSESWSSMRRIGYEVWKRTSLSSVEWLALSPAEWMRVTLPWQVEWARVVSGYMFNMGGRDPLVDGGLWSVTVDCPWDLGVGEQAVSWDDEDVDSASLVSGLVGTSVVSVETASDEGDEPVFVFSHGRRLAVSVSSDPYPAADPYWVSVWGGTFVYNRLSSASVGSDVL